jgi:hypothetical protein
MQALCPTCNLRKGKNSVFIFDSSKCRPGTQEVLLTVPELLAGGKTVISVRMPTRYGKTPTGYLLSGTSTRGWNTSSGLYIPPFASVNVWVTINLLLREQAVNSKKIEKVKNIFSIPSGVKCGEIKEGYISHKHFTPNGEEYLAINIQKIINSTSDENVVNQVFIEWVDSLLHSPTGKRLPPIFHFDECHLYGKDKPYGRAIEQLEKAGALIIVWTATPRRSDGRMIPGFNATEMSAKSDVQGEVVDSFVQDGEKYNIVDQYNVRTVDHLIVADIDIPFSESWANGYLLKASHRMVDVLLSEIDGISLEVKQEILLSKLPESAIKKDGLIGKTVRSPKVVRDMVAMGHSEWVEYKKINPGAAIVVFTVGDRDGSKDEHAMLVKREFHRIDPSMKIDIVTLNVDDSRNIVKDFADNDHDVIIFKQMGGAGWDCERVCVVIDLGDDRQDSTSVQKWMRGGTPDGINKTFALITLQDALTLSIYNRCVKDEGGAATTKEKEWIRTEIRRVKPADEKLESTWVIDAPGDGDISDTDQNRAGREDIPLLDTLKELFPGVRRVYTDAAIINHAKSLGVKVDPLKSPKKEKSIEDVILGLQDDIISIAGRSQRNIYRKLYGTYVPARDGEKWGNAAKQVYNLIYTRAGLSYDGDYVPVRKNRDIEQLRNLERAAQLVEAEINRYEDVSK